MDDAGHAPDLCKKCSIQGVDWSSGLEVRQRGEVRFLQSCRQASCTVRGARLENPSTNTFRLLCLSGSRCVYVWECECMCTYVYLFGCVHACVCLGEKVDGRLCVRMCARLV